MSVLNLDSAAVARTQPTTREAVSAHAELEAEVGAYVAEARVAPVVDRLRADLAGITGHPAAGVALVQGAADALEILLRAWPLPRGARVAVLPSEWGPNLETFGFVGLQVEVAPTDPRGRVDLEALPGFLASRQVALVHLDQAAAQRGLRQPVPAISAVTRAAGVPLWVDAAQGIGQTGEATGADVVYGTSRKWLRGPRAVGFLTVAEEHWARLRVLDRAKWDGAKPVVQMLEPEETHVPGRVGLSAAVAAYVGAREERDAALDQVGALTRAVLDDTPGWRVLPGQEGPITALEPTDGQDPAQVRQRLLDEHAILTTALLPWRAPLDDQAPALRLSPHVDVTEADLRRLRHALVSIR